MVHNLQWFLLMANNLQWFLLMEVVKMLLRTTVCMLPTMESNTKLKGSSGISWSIPNGIGICHFQFPHASLNRYTNPNRCSCRSYYCCQWYIQVCQCTSCSKSKETNPTGRIVRKGCGCCQCHGIIQVRSEERRVGKEC